MKPVEIRVDELLLRPCRPDDAPAQHRACQDPILQHWTSGLPVPFPLTEAVRFVGEAAPAALADGTALFLAIVDHATGEVLGNTDLRGIDVGARTAELAYWSAPWARGRRVTERASRALLRWGFDELGLARVDWRATVGNHASRLTGLRLGFTTMGVLPKSARLRDGSLTDQWVGALLPADLTAAGAELPEAVRRSAATFGVDRTILAAGPVTLRPPAERDLAAVVVTHNDSEVVRWLDVPQPYTDAHARSYVREQVPGGWAQGTHAAFVIADGNDAYAGAVDIRITPADPAIGDIAVMTAPHVRGRGYAANALSAAARWGFEALGLDRVQWRIEVGNNAARRVAEKVGFRMEGTIRAALPGGRSASRRDCWLSALLPGDLV